MRRPRGTTPKCLFGGNPVRKLETLDFPIGRNMLEIDAARPAIQINC
jgi:hypothetical protein